MGDLHGTRAASEAGDLKGASGGCGEADQVLEKPERKLKQEKQEIFG